MSPDQRIFNFFIDSIVFFGVTLFVIWVTSSLMDPLRARYLFIGFYFLYYLGFEFVLGKTVGKYFTGTRVVNESDLTHPTFIQILIRTICRIIPLYFITYFMTGKGVHDHFSKTILIKT